MQNAATIEPGDGLTSEKVTSADSYLQVRKLVPKLIAFVAGSIWGIRVGVISTFSSSPETVLYAKLPIIEGWGPLDIGKSSRQGLGPEGYVIVS